MKYIGTSYSHPILSAWLALTLMVFAACKGVEESAVRDGPENYSQDIKISMNHPYNASDSDFELLLSTPLSMDGFAACWLTSASPACEAGSDKYFEAEAVFATTQRKFFLVTSSVLLEDNMILRFVALQGGATADMRDIKFNPIAGAETPPASSGSTTDAGAATSGAGATAKSISVIVTESCGGGGCHDNYAANPESMKNSNSIARINDDTMPRNRSMSEADKTALLTS